VAHLANGQIAGKGDLVSLLAGDENASFASLLGLGGGGHAAAHRDDGSRAKQGNRPKEKESHEGQTPASQNPKLSATLNSPRLQAIPNVAIAPWQLESGNPRATEDAGDVSPSSSIAIATNVAPQDRKQPFLADARGVNALVSNRQQVLDENAAEVAPFHDLNDPELIEPSKGTIVKNQDTTATEPVAPSNGKGADPAVAHSSSATASLAQLSGGTADNGSPSFIPKAVIDPGSVDVSMTRSPSTPNHETRPDREGQNSTISAAQQLSDSPAENGRGQVSSSATPQGIIDAASSSTAGDHSQGNAGDAHRGSPDAKEVVAVSRVPTTQTQQGSALATLGSAGSANGHSTLINATHPEPVQGSTPPNTQLKDVASLRVADANTTRLLGSTMRSDLRVGVQTEAFGRVTIQTNAQGGQLSAQLSLENAKESATLAAHLPGVEQKIVQQQGLNASIRLVSGFDGGAGAGSMGRDQSGSDRREPERYQTSVAMRQEGIGHDPSNEARGVETALLGRKYWVSSRLDVTV
jgi:hypothetical protein